MGQMAAVCLTPLIESVHFGLFGHQTNPRCVRSAIPWLYMCCTCVHFVGRWFATVQIPSQRALIHTYTYTYAHIDSHSNIPMRYAIFVVCERIHANCIIRVFPPSMPVRRTQRACSIRTLPNAVVCLASRTHTNSHTGTHMPDPTAATNSEEAKISHQFGSI